MTDRSPDSSHAALMDNVYRYQRYIYDFSRKYYLFGRDRLIRELALRPDETLVEVGCGTARNLIRIARLYPNSRLFGLDASGEMLKTATASVARAGLADRIRLVHGYAEGLGPSLFAESQPFDRAVFSYSLSMIPDWKQALSAAGGALREAGRIHMVDFGDLTGLGRVGASGMKAWLRLFHVAPRIEILDAVEKIRRFTLESPDRLWVSPGRCAFLWHCGVQQALQLASMDVAGGSQAGGNPDGLAIASRHSMDTHSQHRSE